MVDLVSIVAAAVIIILILIIVGSIIRWGIRIIWYLLVNAILGIIILAVANLIPGVEVPIDWITVLISAIAGIPGALVVILLSLIGIVL
ncbi:MAG: pro-sigmaK processing inhibitor BofA family protein [Euryarchaeota archaeon]|nr:pro-sigmaK processing inhibitor BofA family protein [Euryarchaeota archaeon]